MHLLETEKEKGRSEKAPPWGDGHTAVPFSFFSGDFGHTRPSTQRDFQAAGLGLQPCI